MTTIYICGALLLILLIVRFVWRLAHKSGYVDGVNDTNLGRVKQKVIEYKVEPEGRRVEEVHYD